MSVQEIDFIGGRAVAVVTSCKKRYKTSRTVRKECVMQDGTRFVLELPPAELDRVQALGG